MSEERVLETEEEKAIPPVYEDLYTDPPSGYTWALCGACKRELETDFNYCPDCGREIGWGME